MSYTRDRMNELCCQVRIDFSRRGRAKIVRPLNAQAISVYGSTAHADGRSRCWRRSDARSWIP